MVIIIVQSNFNRKACSLTSSYGVSWIVALMAALASTPPS